jgi:DNA-binding SARP family transcriptional activator
MQQSEDAVALITRSFAHADLERADLHALLQASQARDDGAGSLLAAAALVLGIGIADDHFRGFEAAAAVVRARRNEAQAIPEPARRLVVDAGVLVVGAFDELSSPVLPPLAQSLVRRLGERSLPTPLRLAAALGVMSYFDALVDIEQVWWLELAVRDLLAEPDVPQRLEGEWHCTLLHACYSCGATARGDELRQRRAAAGLATPAAVQTKLDLMEAYIALGEQRLDAGRSALDRAEPRLSAAAPQRAGHWHFLASRLAMQEGRLGAALNHARLAVRLEQEACYPARWMGLTLMQEGQVQMARGAYFEAVPFFERAHRAGTGVQADYCTCLADFARALGHAEAGEAAAARASLRSAFGFAAQRQWTGFFRATPALAVRLCAWALEAGIEADFARAVIADRRLEAGDIGHVEWPWPIRVRTLGRFAIEIGGQALPLRGKVAKKPLELLQFIVAAGGSDVASANAVFTLWPELDGDKARAAFNVALHRLRKLLGHDEAVTLELGRLGLAPRVIWVDSLAFESLAEQATLPLTPATARLAQRALALYAGHFLHDDEEHSWHMVQRSRLAGRLKRLARALAEHALAAGDTAAARQVLERAVELDPLAEDLALGLMQLLAVAGERAAALAVFEGCAGALQRLLGAQPSAAARELAAALRAGGGRHATPQPVRHR